MFAGERVYVPKVSADVRKARDERIAAAILKGEAPSSIALRENVSERHARRIIRGRIGGAGGNW